MSGGVGRGGKGEEGEGGVTAAQSAVAGLNIDSRRVAWFHANEPPRSHRVAAGLNHEQEPKTSNMVRNVTRK